MPAEKTTRSAVAAPRRSVWARVRRVGRYSLLTVLAFIIVFPLYITFVNSLLTPESIIERPPTLFPTDPQWSTYSDAWTDGNLGTYMRNSFIVTFAIVAAQVVTSILAAYAFAFLDFPLRNTIFVIFLATLMVPFEVTIITNFETIANLDMLNSYRGMIVPFLATGFGAFLLRQAFLGIPRDLEDAARLDGYGHWRFLARIVVPLTRPAIGALTVFSFLLAWNQYLWPLIVVQDDNLRPVQIGLRQLLGSEISTINVTYAATIIASIPLFILLIVFQKQLVRGLTEGAVKG